MQQIWNLIIPYQITTKKLHSNNIHFIFKIPENLPLTDLVILKNLQEEKIRF